MKKTMLMTALASAVVLMFAGPTSAGTNLVRTVNDVAYDFHSLGHGDVGGFCLNPPGPAPGTASCISVPVQFGEDFVSVTVEDSTGAAVYISVQQENNPEFMVGCGTVTDFPVVDSGPGGTAAADVQVFPWAGPGLNDGVTPCNPGSTNLGGGLADFSFYDDVAN